MKKGMVEVQFNWIFVLIAGAVILAFFFTIVQKQRQIAQEKLTFTLINDLETIATGAQVARGTAQSIDMPNVGIEFECFPDCGPGALACEYRIESQHQDYKDKFIFAPAKLSGRKLLLWTSDWKLPFRIANFMYATDKQVRYVLVTDSSKPSSSALKEKISKLIPQEVVVDEVLLDRIGSIKNENYERTRFVLLDIELTANRVIELDRSFAGASVSAVEIHADSRVRFHNLETRKATAFTATESYYLTDEMMFAAIFSENLLMYECNLKNAFYRLSFSLRLYAERAKNLQKLVVGTEEETRCKNAYDAGLLLSMQQEAGGLAVDMRSLDPGGVPKIQRFKELVNKLKLHNDYLVGQSCPQIY